MVNPIDKSGSGRIILPDLIYLGGKVEIIDPAGVASVCNSMQKRLASYAKTLSRNIALYSGIVDGKGDYTPEQRKSAEKILAHNWKLWEDVEAARIWNNKLLAAIGPAKTRRANATVIVECPDPLALFLYNVRPVDPETPGNYRDFMGWWNFDAFRVDNAPPHGYDIHGDGW